MTSKDNVAEKSGCQNRTPHPHTPKANHSEKITDLKKVSYLKYKKSQHMKFHEFLLVWMNAVRETAEDFEYRKNTLQRRCAHQSYNS